MTTAAQVTDRFDYRGVCHFCRTRQHLHTESRLCSGCLAQARAFSAALAASLAGKAK